MLKSEVKGHGTIKKLRTGAVVSVLALGVAGVSGVVSAEEVTSADTLVSAVASGDTTVTQGQVDKAKSDSVSATNEVKAQEKVVGGIESQISDTQATVDSTKAEISEVEKVTPEVVAEAEGQANTAKEELTKANQTVSSAENTVSVADNKVSEQESVVANAEAEFAKTDKEVSDAKAKVDSLSEGTDTGTLKDKVSKLEETVSSDQVTLKNAQDSLEAGKLAESNKEQAIANQTEVVKTAEGVVESTASDYADALLAQKGTQANEDSAKSALDTAKKGTQVTEKVKTGEINALTADSATLNKGVASSTFLNGKNGVVTNKEYLEAIKNLANGSGSVQAVRDAIEKGYWGNSLETLAAPSSAGFHSWVDNLEYTFSNTDATTKVSVHDLSDEQLTDLSLFYTALVNDLRSRVGSPLLTVTRESLALSKDSVKKIFSTVYGGRYDNMNYNQLKGAGFLNSMSDRDGSGKPLRREYTTSEAISRVNFKDRTVISQNVSITNMDTFDDSHLTMADLKLRILASLGNQLYTDIYNGYGGVNGESYTDFKAAMLILGLDGSTNNSAGVGFDFTDVDQGMVYRSPFMFTTLGNSSGTPIDNPYMTLVNPVVSATPIYKDVTKVVADDNAVARAQADYDSAVKANTNAKEQVTRSETAYTKAQADLLKAQKALADLQNNQVSVPALEKAVKDAEAKLVSDSEALQKAKETLALAEASVEDKAQALKVAKAELEKAISANDLAKGVLSSEQSTLKNLVSQANESRVALSDAKTKQASALAVFNTLDAKAKDLASKLANKDVIWADLNSKLSEAQAKESSLRAELETAKELLETLKADANEKMSEYIRLSTLKAEQDKAEAEVANIKNVSSQTNQSVHNKAITAKITQNIVSRHQAGKTSYQASLPETGDESSLFAIMGVSLLLGLGFVGKRRKV